MSDICLSSFLYYQGLYKPSLLILRSGVENYFKCIGIAYDQNVLVIGSVYELINVVKSTPQVVADNIVRLQVQKLHNIYAILCEHVHTSDANKMSLTSVVGKFPRFKSTIAKFASSQINSACLAVIAINCVILPGLMTRFHHTHRDAVLDSLPAKVKRHLASL